MHVEVQLSGSAQCKPGSVTSRPCALGQVTCPQLPTLSGEPNPYSWIVDKLWRHPVCP